ncbi:MAG: Asp-tRNA(Asn)/Glu-tRNA(Gln) amidotransferase subunit GatC [Gammaproteobacteria bacterium]|nr:Asp-tRNA(Asn)/Glu-tRNA(Gln) amidotransferase subunit GatC [Gammaproteobacteria bacterium]
MAISNEEVAAVARLARLGLDPEDIPGYAAQLSGILAFVARLNEVDTSAIEPLAHPLDLHARLREDAVTESDQRDAFQTHAPAVEAGLYLVPKVIE